jgi:predicted exporter
VRDRELAWLFLAGLIAMGIYLAVLQRSVARVLYVLAPLFVSALASAVYIRCTGATVDIMHILAFSLIIAVATDYGSILVSTGHGPPEPSEVLLTGAPPRPRFPSDSVRVRRQAVRPKAGFRGQFEKGGNRPS